jgi:hypothetical protein
VFAYLGESGTVIANAGVTTADEMALGLPDVTGLSLDEATNRLFEADEGSEHQNGKSGGHARVSAIPYEETVTALAGQWSVNPSLIEDMGLPASVGLCGVLPARFRL